MMGSKCMTILMLLGLVGMMVARVASQAHDYGDALSKCILFFEGQRSGKLPSTQRMTWRKNSALYDGSDVGMDLVGGYYDAGDNVKFNFPMAFTTTMLAWSVIEFGQFMGPDLQHALEAVRWGSDYFLFKVTKRSGSVVATVGDPNGDHDCWERPEDMDTPRTTYIVDQTHPGSELAGEVAAALAASSMVFKNSDPKYSNWLLARAKQAFDFGNKYPGSYNYSVWQGVCPFYCDFSGYVDELLWAAAWIYKASNDNYYWNYLVDNIHLLETSTVKLIDGNPYVGGSFAEFGWDSKHAGINVLTSSWVMNTPKFDPFVTFADKFVCSLLPESPTKSVTYTPGGLLYKSAASNIQAVTASSFLVIVYARYMKAANKGIYCGNVGVTPSRLIEYAKGQVDYILGSNPLQMSYMVGYGKKYPKKIHHRGSSVPSIDQQPQHLRCRDGDQYFQSDNPDPNVLTGALVGGPDHNDQFEDSRYNVPQSEPTTYMNAPFVGVLAYFKQVSSKWNISEFNLTSIRQ